MAPARLAALAAALTIVLPAQALAGSIDVRGTGAITFQTARSATTFATTVRAPGRIKLVTAGPSTFRPVCATPKRKRCVKFDHKHGQWVVLRAVKFYYSGSAFKLTVRAKKGFDVGITGRGKLNLNGSGTYTQAGVANAYAGIVHLRLT